MSEHFINEAIEHYLTEKLNGELPILKDLNRALNWELYHGPLPANYWTEVEPLESIRWHGTEWAAELLRGIIKDVPSEVFINTDCDVSIAVSENDPQENPANWYILDPEDDEADFVYGNEDGFDELVERLGWEMVTQPGDSDELHSRNPLEVILHKDVFSHYV